MFTHVQAWKIPLLGSQAGCTPPQQLSSHHSSDTFQILQALPQQAFPMLPGMPIQVSII